MFIFTRLLLLLLNFILDIHQQTYVTMTVALLKIITALQNDLMD